VKKVFVCDIISAYHTQANSAQFNVKFLICLLNHYLALANSEVFLGPFPLAAKILTLMELR
jgi:hypothetical protein